MNYKKKGFTLIELLAVIVILAIIALIAVPLVLNARENARRKIFENNIRGIIRAIEYKDTFDQNFDIYDINTETVKSILNLSNKDYESVEVSLLDKKIYIKVVGKNAWKGLVGYGLYEELTVRDVDEFDAISCQVYNPGYNPNYVVANEPQGCIPISTVDDFINIKNNLSGKYCLKNDIDLSGINTWEPIGAAEEEPFTGEIYGNNFYIKNLNINYDGFFSLFGYIENAKFYDLKFNNIKVEGNRDMAIISYNSKNNLDIVNCVIDNNNKLVSNGDYTTTVAGFVASIIGEGTVNINNCYSNINFNSGDKVSPYIGGIYSSLITANINNSTTISNSKKDDLNFSFGGFVDYNGGTLSIKKSKAKITLEGNQDVGGSDVGGFIAETTYNTSIEDSISQCNFSMPNGYYSAGCFVGYSQILSAKNLIVFNSKSHIKGGSYGGIVGRSRYEFNASDICIKDSTFHGGDYTAIGGLIGSSNGEINNEKTKIFNIDFKGENIGGLFGNAFEPNNVNLIDSQYIKIHDSVERIGGIIGQNHNNLSLNKVKFNNINFNNIKDGVGTIIGCNYSNATINDIFINDVIMDNINEYAGGIIGGNYSDVTLNNININNININNAKNRVGGIIGATYSEVNLDNTKLTGKISNANEEIGGIIGINSTNINISNTSLNMDISGDLKVGGISGVSYADTNINNIEINGSIVGGNPSTYNAGGTGGLFGIHVYSITGNNVKVNAAISGGNIVGGFIGAGYTREDTTILNNFTFNGTVTCPGTYSNNKVALYYEDFL